MRQESKILIGDIHGCYKTLRKLISKIAKSKGVDEETLYSQLVSCGDIIDRGPQSREVIDFLRANKVATCLGNHEDFAKFEVLEKFQDFDFLFSPGWMNEGGREFLQSYKEGDSFNLKQMKKDLKWIKSRPLYFEFKEIKNQEGRRLIVSHSAITNYYTKRRSQAPAIMWNREVETNSVKDIKTIYNVFGHTNFSKAKVEKHYACIDTGCCYKDNPDQGKLTALEFPSMKIWTQKNID